MATYKITKKDDGATLAIYEGKSAAAASKQHLEALGHEVSVASSSEVFAHLKGQKYLFRDNPTPAPENAP